MAPTNFRESVSNVSNYFHSLSKTWKVFQTKSNCFCLKVFYLSLFILEIHLFCTLWLLFWQLMQCIANKKCFIYWSQGILQLSLISDPDYIGRYCKLVMTFCLWFCAITAIYFRSFRWCQLNLPSLLHSVLLSLPLPNKTVLYNTSWRRQKEWLLSLSLQYRSKN